MPDTPSTPADAPRRRSARRARPACTGSAIPTCRRTATRRAIARRACNATRASVSPRCPAVSTATVLRARSASPEPATRARNVRSTATAAQDRSASRTSVSNLQSARLRLRNARHCAADLRRPARATPGQPARTNPPALRCGFPRRRAPRVSRPARPAGAA